MPKYNFERHLPYQMAELVPVVNDVERYPEFMPWILEMEVSNAERSLTDAFARNVELSVGWRAFKERVSLVIESHVQAPQVRLAMVRGPLKSFTGAWHFAEKEDGTDVHFEMTIEFSNPLFSGLFKINRERIAARMMNVFSQRAYDLYRAQ